MMERIEAVFLQRPFKVMALVKLRISRVEPRDKMVKVYNLFYSGRMPI